ncbi:type I methionyl aminopeptidase [Rufibacter glacialis]|uniref:Methionine aminopeptidase n=1 Tax=Rufibacter glacialis TaxID=1259555 RepID=A0A5M8QPW2_9BACT|nr:type I methionyl aminopeptidase [Rufibacter glacialis]KAA6437318.1 type I methionyl aminopeptidase [Rufibacter glacialis]GGK60226.1 methionine aminopeptidase [Rufibacter glacialis]
MIIYKTEEEIELIKESANILSQVHGEIAKYVAEGVTTLKLDSIAEEFISDHGGSPSFKGYNGFKHSLCISLNSEVVHGIPSTYALQSGDVVSIDCGVFFKGFHSDSAYSHPVGDVAPEVLDLLARTKESLYKGIEWAVAGARIGDIGHAVQTHVEQFGYGVVRELVGHGLGRSLHEGPEVPNYGKRGQGMKLQEGLVLAIEPMVNLGSRHVVQENDGWTIRTRDKKPSAHFEHTVVVRKGKAEILTTFDYIDKALN